MRSWWNLLLILVLVAFPTFVGCGGVSMESSDVTPTDTGDDGTEDEDDGSADPDDDDGSGDDE